MFPRREKLDKQLTEQQALIATKRTDILKEQQAAAEGQGSGSGGREDE